MIEFIFTVDYEIYGDGSGSLKDLVIEPADLLLGLFDKYRVPMVIFVEAAEFDLINQYKTDKDIDFVIRQVRSAYKRGHEIGLHIHPQWYNARHDGARWQLDRSEYNLCILPEERIKAIVARAKNFIKFMVDDQRFDPISFRAGNWLFQPTQPAAKILYDNEVRIDSSVFKGGRFKEYSVNYRKAMINGYFWKFEEDVAIENPDGKMLEIPIYARMVPFWQMVTQKRFFIEKGYERYHQSKKGRWRKIKDYFNLKYPKKLDFCRLTERELKEMIEFIIKTDCKSPSVYKPIVAIGHTKDLRDINAVEYLLNFLRDYKIPVTTFSRIYMRMI